ncbi:MAG: flavodoxin family protein [Spirochaetes bacterium]|uniref:Flavodoxin family protein n=1 Tax=Candidatus Aphodenecus pullistercoris TaxID=2840669 RepID=A0A9D9HBH4_9SPIR|nr:flavodoxin family protein [Candidatus Aphodenecus pullistercoris]
MRVLMVNGSPRRNGNTPLALDEMEKVFKEEGVEVDRVDIGTEAVRGCIACNSCAKTGKCVFDDKVNEARDLFEKADGLVVASPVYFASANASLVAFLQRLFYSSSFDMTMKVGAAVAAARRGGLTATYDELNKFFGISGMPIASGQYWNGIHGREKGEAAQDAEGLQMMRTLARNMVFLVNDLQHEAAGMRRRLRMPDVD